LSPLSVLTVIYGILFRIYFKGILAIFISLTTLVDSGWVLKSTSRSKRGQIMHSLADWISSDTELKGRGEFSISSCFTYLAEYLLTPSAVFEVSGGCVTARI